MNKIFKVTPAGVISTIAGNGNYKMAPDGAVAAASPVASPSGVLADGQGGLYFEESPTSSYQGNIIRYISPAGVLKTIAGNGKGGFTDGVPAVQSGMMMQSGTGLALDQAGNLYISDGFNYRVRMVAPNGIISTIAGNGTPGSGGDGTLAKNASLFVPRGLLFDTAGDLLISDTAANRIRSILATRPPVTASPTQMTFTAQAGGAQTPAQQLTISSPVSGINFTVTKTAGASWLVLGSTSGSTPRLIKVMCDPTNLTAGTYQATLTISTPLAIPASTTVTLTVQVAAGAGPKLVLDRAALSFTFPRNASASLTRSVKVTNAGTGTFAFSTSIQPAGKWLSVSPTSGSATPQTSATLTVSANPNGMPTGTYTGSITVSSPAGGSATVLVTMTVSSLDQAIWLSHTALSFTAVAQGGVIPPDTFAVTNIGNGSMNFTVSTRTLSGGQWLSATPTSGVAISGDSPPLVTVSVHPSALAAGLYYGMVRIDSPGSANTPQVVTVAFQVLPAGQDPGPQIQPAEVVFTAMQGAPPPGSVNLEVYNISATPQTYLSSITASNANDQIDFRPATSTLNPAQPTRVVLQPLTSALAVGVYDDELTLQFSDGYIRRVGIRTVIKPAPPVTSSNLRPRTDTTATDAAGACTASRSSSRPSSLLGTILRHTRVVARCAESASRRRLRQ